jgi:hypothetical protein
MIFRSESLPEKYTEGRIAFGDKNAHASSCGRGKPRKLPKGSTNLIKREG